ncbi:hypothetical protein Adt_01852 [Abeliophyllum distichum]|uniref:Uncharacterized protein n=1 Tax=Abeliophyllum distichum TaxID=126358 RepID=A0ABD1VU12_9LAMI
MGRGRGKGRKLSATDQDDTGSGDEEKVPVQKRRGRPQKSPKNKIDEDEDSENNRIGAFDEEVKSMTATQNGKRSEGNAEAKEKADPVKEENVNGIRLCINVSPNKLKGIRPNGNRRKNKPRRAAEACVECI